MCAPSVCIEDISIVFMRSWSYVRAASIISSGAPSFITLASIQTQTRACANVSWGEGVLAVRLKAFCTRHIVSTLLRLQEVWNSRRTIGSHLAKSLSLSMSDRMSEASGL